jgi:hypothetical protein
MYAQSMQRHANQTLLTVVIHLLYYCPLVHCGVGLDEEPEAAMCLGRCSAIKRTKHV